MTWVREKSAILETRSFPDAEDVRHVIGWVDRRHCGCVIVEGMRLDNHDRTMGAEPCDQHEAQLLRAYETFALMPPSTRIAHELFEELIDREIEPWVT